MLPPLSRHLTHLATLAMAASCLAAGTPSQATSAGAGAPIPATTVSRAELPDLANLNATILAANKRLAATAANEVPTLASLFPAPIDVTMLVAEVRRLEGGRLELVGSIEVNRTVSYDVAADRRAIDEAQATVKREVRAHAKARQAEGAIRSRADLEIRNFDTARRWSPKKQRWIHPGSQCRHPPQTNEAHQLARQKLLSKWSAEVEKLASATRSAHQAVASAKRALSQAEETLESNCRAATERAKTVTVRAIIPGGEDERTRLEQVRRVRLQGRVEAFAPAVDSEEILRPARYVGGVTLRGTRV